MTTWCCESFYDACATGSDHDLTGAAIRADDGEWWIGNCVNILHCPYCGKILEPPIKEDKT